MHRSAVVGTKDPVTDEISFSILKVAGVFRGEYLIIEGNDLKTIEEIDSPATDRAVRLLWQGESVTDDHIKGLKTRLLCRTISLA